jgi:hypothetical protein
MCLCTYNVNDLKKHYNQKNEKFISIYNLNFKINSNNKKGYQTKKSFPKKSRKRKFFFLSNLCKEELGPVLANFAFLIPLQGAGGEKCIRNVKQSFKKQPSLVCYSATLVLICLNNACVWWNAIVCFSYLAL